jgi:hypothetical protein
MYHVVGADGKTYGPIGLDQLKKWVTEGRIGPQTQIQEAGAAAWKTAAAMPELAPLLYAGAPRPGANVPPTSSPLPTGAPRTGLAVTSLVLGILSMICFLILTGIPAIICGHIALNRARRLPGAYGGSGMAIAGLVLGYASILIALVIPPALLLPALAHAKERAQRTNCSNNLKQVGIAFKVWALDNGEQYPFNVSTNKGGTFEFCSVGADGFDQNAALHFTVLSNEMGTPKILVCPKDSRLAALDFQTLGPANVTYQLHSGTNLDDSHPQAVLAVCPIHGNVLLCDGSVQYWPQRKSR